MKFIILLFGVCTSTLGAKLPQEIPICSMSDSNFRKCLISSAETAFSVFAAGYAPLKLPPFDPLYLKEIVVEPQSGPFDIYQKYTDIYLHGASTGKVVDFGIDLNDCKIWLNHTLKPLRVAGIYEMRGKLLMLPVSSKGHVIADAGEFTIQLTATCEKYTRHGENHIRVLTNNLNFITKDLVYNFGTLINNNPQLNRELHKVIQDNPIEFFEVMRPTCQEMWSTATKKIMNSVFTQIPLQDLFRD